MKAADCHTTTTMRKESPTTSTKCWWCWAASTSFTWWRLSSPWSPTRTIATTISIITRWEQYRSKCSYFAKERSQEKPQSWRRAVLPSSGGGRAAPLWPRPGSGDVPAGEEEEGDFTVGVQGRSGERKKQSFKTDVYWTLFVRWDSCLC